VYTRRPRRALRTVAGALAFTLLFVSAAAAAAQDTGTDETPPDVSQVVAPTALDACQVVPSSEASSLAGVTYTSGLAGTTSGGGQTCVYGSQTLNVFMVVVAQAPDAATAQADWAQEQSRVQDLLQRNLPAGVTITANLNDVSDLPAYDRAAIGQGSLTIGGRTIGLSAIYLLKGPTFVSYSDLVVGQAPPTADALESEAQTVLGRLP
jgi:hypothetical protein